MCRGYDGGVERQPPILDYHKPDPPSYGFMPDPGEWRSILRLATIGVLLLAILHWIEG
jgi:hypothetical protein